VHAYLAANADRVLPSTVEPQAPLAQYIVEVTNTGPVDADDVVLGFLKPPGAGVAGTPLQTLFGFERVHVPKGKTVKVYLGSTIRDFVQVNQHGKHHAVSGEYVVQFGVPETAQHGMGFATTSVIAV
jgi:beta-D-xylosidase 4